MKILLNCKTNSVWDRSAAFTLVDIDDSFFSRLERARKIFADDKEVEKVYYYFNYFEFSGLKWHDENYIVDDDSYRVVEDFKIIPVEQILRGHETWVSRYGEITFECYGKRTGDLFWATLYDGTVKELIADYEAHRTIPPQIRSEPTGSTHYFMKVWLSLGIGADTEDLIGVDIPDDSTLEQRKELCEEAFREWRNGVLDSGYELLETGK